MSPFDCYKIYIGLKNHYCRDSYDYFKYCKKTKASLQSFYKRRDRFFFEKLSRQKTEKEIEDFFVANFASCNDPETLWIGDIIKNGDEYFQNWKRKTQSLTYIFKEQSSNLLNKYKLEELFDCSKGHPILLKKYLAKEIDLEILVIYNNIFNYVKNFDKKLQDPIWNSVSRRIKKYSPFINVDKGTYKSILKELVLDASVT